MISSTIPGYSASIVGGQINLVNDSRAVTFGSAISVQLVEDTRGSGVLLYWLSPTGALSFGSVSSDLTVTNTIQLVATGVTAFYAKYLLGVGTSFAYVVGTTLTINIAGTTTTGNWGADRLPDFSYDVSNDLQTVTILYSAGTPVQAYTETYSAQVKAEAPTFTPGAGTYQTVISVVLSTNTPNAVIRYTVDGTDPTDASTAYTGAIPLTGSATLKAITTAPGYIDSDIATAAYDLVLKPKAITPTFTPVAGSYTTALAVEIISLTPNKTIRYTLDGTEPTMASDIYFGSITITSDTTIKAFATAPGYRPSDVGTAVYLVDIPPPTPEDHVDPQYSVLKIYDFKMGLRVASAGFAVDSNR